MENRIPGDRITDLLLLCKCGFSCPELSEKEMIMMLEEIIQWRELEPVIAGALDKLTTAKEKKISNIENLNIKTPLY